MTTNSVLPLTQLEQHLKTGSPESLPLPILAAHKDWRKSLFSTLLVLPTRKDGDTYFNWPFDMVLITLEEGIHRKLPRPEPIGVRERG